ncbi:MAG: PorT family protein, partial [bacterium]|nr:PorT family protein [bacterium]
MKKIILTALILTVIKALTFAQLFEDEQKFIIRDSSINMLKEFVEYADLSSDGVSVSNNYIPKFLALFTEDAKIVDVLSGKKKFIFPTDYIETIISKYSGGIEVKIELDSAYFKNLRKIEEDIYSVQIDCKQYTIGLSKKNKIFRNDIEATYTIYFNYRKNEFSDFRIHEIISKEIISKRISDKEMKGLYIGANVQGLVGRLHTNNNIEYYNRNYNLSGAFSGGVFADYYFNSNYAVSIGANYYNLYSNFNTKYNNETDRNIPITDIDNDSCFLYINSDFKEKNNLQYLSVPVKFKYRTKLHNNISFFASAGVSVSFVLSSNSKIKGNSAHSAWYESYNLIVDEAEMYNLGSTVYDNKFDLDITKQFFSGSISAGVSIPVSKSSFLNISAEINHSFSSLNYNESTYRDDYMNIHGKPKNMYIQQQLRKLINKKPCFTVLFCKT